MSAELSRRNALRVTAAGTGAAALVAAAGPTAAATGRHPGVPRLGGVPLGAGHHGDGVHLLRAAPALDGGPLSVSGRPFGYTAAGQRVDRWTFGNDALEISMLTYGALIQTIRVPDRNGVTDNVTLGFRDLHDYETISPYFGATIGRYANRIAKGRFTLDGRTYQIPVNNGPNALHGGPEGFNSKVWRATEVREPKRVGVRFTYVSPDGEMGFPGTLTTQVSYLVDRTGHLYIHYTATTTKPTIVNLTNHAYLNLLGEGRGEVYDHQLVLAAQQYTPIDATSIPLGPQASVAGTPFDFRAPNTIGGRIREGVEQIVLARGYDHNWVLDGRYGAGVRLVAQAHERTTGRYLQCWTDQPGVQVYTGNFLDASIVGYSGRVYRQGSAFTLETQHYPDSPNEPAYPSTVLRPGQTYRTTTAFGFSAG